MSAVQTVKKTDRLDMLDYAKAVGALLVVLSHVTARTGAPFLPYFTLRRDVYSFHMPLFFIITGVGLYLRYLKENSYYIDIKASRAKLFSRLIVPYLVWSAIFAPVLALVDDEPFFTALRLLLLKAVTGEGIPPLWFLSALFSAELLVLLILKRFENAGETRRYNGLVCTLGIFALCWFACWKLYGEIKLALGEPSSVRFSVRIGYSFIITALRIVPSAFFILFGLCFGAFYKKINDVPTYAKAFFALIFMEIVRRVQGGFFNELEMHAFHFTSMPLALVTGVCGSLSVLFAVSLIPSGVKPLSDAGKRSMDIMLLHYLPTWVIPYLFKKFGFAEFRFPYYVWMAALFALSWLLSRYALEMIRNALFRKKTAALARRS